MRALLCILLVVLGGLFACRDNDRGARDRRNALPPTENSRSLWLMSPNTPILDVYNGFEYRVSVADTAEERGRAVRVHIRVRSASEDSTQFRVNPCAQDLRLYDLRRAPATLAYSWRHHRICAGGETVYFLAGDDTLPFRPTLRGYEIGGEVRHGEYELRVTLPGDTREREVVIGFVRLTDTPR